MIRILISFILILFCSSNAFAQSYRERMRTAIDIGSHFDPFAYADTCNTGDYTNDYSCPESSYPSAPTNDIFYKLTLEHSMNLFFTHQGGPFSYVNIHILDHLGNEVKHLNANIHYAETAALLPGVYYLVYEPTPEGMSGGLTDGILPVHIEGEYRQAGEDFSCPLFVGTFDAGFTLSPGVQYPMDYVLDYRLTGDPDIDDSRADMVHQFTVSQPMELTMDNSGSGQGLAYNYFHSALMSSPTDSVSVVSKSLVYGGYCLYK